MPLEWHGDAKVSRLIANFERAANAFIQQEAYSLRGRIVDNINTSGQRVIHGSSQTDPTRPHLKNMLSQGNQVHIQRISAGCIWAGIGYIPELDRLVGSYRRAKTGEIVTALSLGRPRHIWRLLEFGTSSHSIPLRKDGEDAPLLMTLWKRGRIYALTAGVDRHPGIYNPKVNATLWSKYLGTIHFRNRLSIGKAPFRRAAYAWVAGAGKRLKQTAARYGATMRRCNIS